MPFFSTFHRIFFQNSFSKFSKKYFFLNFHFFFFFSKFWKTVSKKKFYMISWKNKHFSLLTFFEIFDFWNNDYLILPIFWPKPSSDKSPLIPSCSKWISWAYFRKKLKIQCETQDLVFSTASKLRGVTVAPRRGLRGVPPYRRTSGW